MKAAFTVLLFLPFLANLSGAEAGPAAKPFIDNERVRVWDFTWTKGQPDPADRHQYDAVLVYLTGGAVKVTAADGKSTVVNRKSGDAIFEPKGSTRSEEGTSDSPAHSVIIALKDHPVAPLKNTSGFPNAFPREGAKKLLDNSRVNVWDYRWQPGVPTVMHFHNTDVLVTYFENGSLKSTPPKGEPVINDYTAGLIKFNLRDRAHMEVLTKGTQRAIMTELK